MTIISVNKSDARVLQSEKFYIFAKNIYKMYVAFDQTWDGLIKTAHFKLDDIHYDVDMTHLNEIDIPWELFACAKNVGKTLQVSFDGKWEDHIIVPTPSISLGVIRMSEIDAECGYTPPGPSTPSPYQQLKAEIETKADDATFDTDTRIFKLWSSKNLIREFEIPGGEGGSDASFEINDATIMFGKKSEPPVVSNDPVTMFLHEFVGAIPKVGKTYTGWISDGKVLYTCVLLITEIDQDKGFVKCRILSVMPLIQSGTPSGGIILWSGSEIPDGWALCDGQNERPNLPSVGNFPYIVKL